MMLGFDLFHEVGNAIELVDLANDCRDIGNREQYIRRVAGCDCVRDLGIDLAPALRLQADLDVGICRIESVDQRLNPLHATRRLLHVPELDLGDGEGRHGGEKRRGQGARERQTVPAP